MRRSLPKAILITGMLSALAMSAQGCADNETMLFVRAVLKLDSGQQCVAKADPNATVLLGGLLDTALTDHYNAALLVGNQLVNRGSKKQLRTESDRIVLKGAEVNLLDDQETQLTNFTAPGTGFVDLGSGEDAGYGVLATTLIPAGFAQPGKLYIVDVRVFGETLGGSEITSKALRFPVYTCDKCSISFPPDADDPAQSGYQCVTSGTSSTAAAKPCFDGQDDLTDCRLCVNTNPACAAP